MFLLDTNVISELRAGKPGQSPQVREWASAIPESQFYLSAVTILELEQGILRLERRVPPQGSALRAWFEAVRAAFGGRVLPFTDNGAMLCAAMHVSDAKDYRDSLIAATALEHGLTLATGNVRDFADTGVALVDPWATA
jgi:predicted nucleic acid-binding protein